MEKEYVLVRLLNIPYNADIEYTYFLPDIYRDEISKGSLVIIPFGKSDRNSIAIVVGFSKKAQTETKNVISVLNSFFKLSEPSLELCDYLRNTTLCSFGDAVKCMIPISSISNIREKLYITEKELKSTDDSLVKIERFIKENGPQDLKKIKRLFKESGKNLDWLIKNKYLQCTIEIDEKDSNTYETIISLSIDKDEANSVILHKSDIKIRSEKQLEIIQLLCEYDSLTDTFIYSQLGANKSHIDALLKKGIISVDKKLITNDYLSKIGLGDNKDITLNEEQEKAFGILKSLYQSGKPNGALLYGVTGSGKTSVIKKMIDEVIKSGKVAMVLVPEISLTPQAISIFCGYYKERVALIHSSLSARERFESYKKVKENKADVIIGTRSAVFAPCDNIGMIVIDEEQEHTYKSESNPKYLTHDVARFLCAKNNALMLLASATPSLESYRKALMGKYTLVKLSHRYGNATLPDVIITDMKKERKEGNISSFGSVMVRCVEKTLEDSNQVILFLNRRGYHNYLSCSECGKPIECPNCSVALTYHSFKKVDDTDADNMFDVMSNSGVLRCHYCGYQTRVPKECPSCGKGKMEYIGFGTQKLEQDISRLFPSARTIRLDADTTSTKFSYDKILSSFKDGNTNILIGTQMVTKGHDFPHVTLVGVVLADSMLYRSDYKSSERTFSLITQVIGRAGRAKDKGVAVIQTNSPNDKTIIYAASQDYESFYRNEINIRSAYSFPPFCDIVVISVLSSDELMLTQDINGVLNELKDLLADVTTPYIVYGPFDAPIYKVNGKYKKRIVMKCKVDNKMRSILGEIYAKYITKTKNQISVDINPSSI